MLSFWFDELGPADWFRYDPSLDLRITARFGQTLLAAERGELSTWQATPSGSLALIILLDQFSRNIHRHRSAAFANDPLALAVAQACIARGYDTQLPVERRLFMYMPYMHSESLQVHGEALVLFSTPGLETNLEFERGHKAIIERFGRYPQRNSLLGRPSTPEEIEFLSSSVSTP